MFDSKSLVEIYRLGNKVSVELVEVVIKKRREVLWQVFGLLKTRSESVCKGGNVRNMLIFLNLGFFLNTFLELSISICVKQPLEDGLLNLLIVFLFKEVIVEKLD